MQGEAAASARLRQLLPAAERAAARLAGCG